MFQLHRYICTCICPFVCKEATDRVVTVTRFCCRQGYCSVHTDTVIWNLKKDRFAFFFCRACGQSFHIVFTMLHIWIYVIIPVCLAVCPAISLAWPELLYWTVHTDILIRIVDMCTVEFLCFTPLSVVLIFAEVFKTSENQNLLNSFAYILLNC